MITALSGRRSSNACAKSLVDQSRTFDPRVGFGLVGCEGDWSGLRMPAASRPGAKKKPGTVVKQATSTDLSKAGSKGKAGGKAGAAVAKRAGHGAGGLVGGVGIVTLGGRPVIVEEDEDEGEEEEESEDAQMCWSIMFSCFPVLVEIVTEFAGAAMDAGICQYLAMLLLPIWSGIKTLFGIANMPPSPPAYAPPAPPPPPEQPDLITAVSAATFGFAEAHPMYYMLTDISIAVALGTLYLYWQAITDWWEERQSKARQAAMAAADAEAAASDGYQKLVDDDLESGMGGDVEEEVLPEVKTVAQLGKELRLINDKVEELEIKTKVHRKSTSEKSVAMRVELKGLQGRRDELQRIVNGASAAKSQKQELAAAAAAAGAQADGEGGADGGEAQAVKVKKKKAPPKPPGAGMGKQVANTLQTILKGPVMQVITRTFTGVMAISLYFADIISDIQVIQLLWNTKNWVWAWMSIFLLVAQFVVVYLRVLPYLSTTFGGDSWIYLVFLWLGLPWGLLFLDCLMFLEPFGLLTILPFPPWLKQFLPAFKATRTIAEVVIESLPQSLLQAYIYIVVIQHTRDGTATDKETAMLEFADALPKSILISTLATLKTWMEVVSGARAAGLTVMDKALQLWHVGAGLPLDALKKGTIVDWACPYRLDESEVTPLLDALSKNGSLTRLDLGRSGIEWNDPNSMGMMLVEKMAHSMSALSDLQSFVIREAGYPIPVARLRNEETALEAIRQATFFTEGGPRFEEIVFIGDLLRKDDEEPPADQVVKLLAQARTGKVKKAAWHEKVTQLMVAGALRRGHLFSLIAAEALRDVGYSAAELLASAFTLPTMREGGYLAAEMRAVGKTAGELWASGYTAAELKKGGYKARDLKAAEIAASAMKAGGYVAKEMKGAGFSAGELKDHGYSARDLREGTFVAKDLKPLGFTAGELREAGFDSTDLRAVSFTLLELKGGAFTATECKEAKYYAHEMRAAGFTALELKKANYSGVELRSGGYSAIQMKEADFTAKRVKGAGYSSTEAVEAGWTIEVLKDAGYEAKELRDARCTAAQLKAVCFQLPELRGAGYTTTELQEVGYGAEELRAAGTSLSELTSAGSSVADLKAAGEIRELPPTTP